MVTLIFFFMPNQILAKIIPFICWTKKKERIYIIEVGWGGLDTKNREAAN